MANLTGHVFNIKSAKDSGLATQAEAALARANPHLQNLEKIPAGTLIFVPEVPGASLGDVQPAFPLGEQLATRLSQTLADAKAVIERSAEMQAAKVKATAKFAKSKEFKNLASKDPGLKKGLPKIAAESRARLKEIAATKAAHLEDHAVREKSLHAFLKHFGCLPSGNARLNMDSQGVGEHLLTEVQFQAARVAKPTRKRKRR